MKERRNRKIPVVINRLTISFKKEKEATVAEAIIFDEVALFFLFCNGLLVNDS